VARFACPSGKKMKSSMCMTGHSSPPQCTNKVAWFRAQARAPPNSTGRLRTLRNGAVGPTAPTRHPCTGRQPCRPTMKSASPSEYGATRSADLTILLGKLWAQWHRKAGRNRRRLHACFRDEAWGRENSKHPAPTLQDHAQFPHRSVGGLGHNMRLTKPPAWGALLADGQEATIWPRSSCREACCNL